MKPTAAILPGSPRNKRQKTSGVRFVTPAHHPKSRFRLSEKRERRDASTMRHWRRRLADQLTLLYPVAGWVALFWRWLLWRTVRVDRRGGAFDLLEKGQPFIFTYWHQDQLPVLFEISRSFSFMPPLYMISPGRAGALGSSVLGVVGVETVAGSSSNKGWRAIRILSHRAKLYPQSVFILADGSRGPHQQVRWGAVNVARDTGLPIVAGRGWGNNLITLRWTWMKLVIPFPRPWGRGVLLTSEPLYVKPDATDEELAACRDELQKRLDELTEASLDYFSGKPEAADRFGARRDPFPTPSASRHAKSGQAAS